jgi:RimJ/RimL family protein N-acetyltransferase
MKDRYFKKVEGERVYLSPIHVDDANQYVQWLNDSEVTDGHGTSSLMITSVYEKNWIETALKSEKSYFFAIVKKDKDELIGNIGFNEIDNIHRTANVGLFIGDTQNRGRGLGTEAMRLAVKYGFDVLNLNNINLYVFSFNEQAIKSYIKVGFKEYGRRRQAYYLNNVYHDVVCMDILREEYYL